MLNMMSIWRHKMQQDRSCTFFFKCTDNFIDKMRNYKRYELHSRCKLKAYLHFYTAVFYRFSELNRN